MIIFNEVGDRVFAKWLTYQVVAKTWNGTERNKMERSVIFWLLTRKFSFRVRDTEIEVFRV